MKFDGHIKSVSNKISRSIGIFYKLKNIVNHSCLKTLYYSFVHPYLLYGLIVWGSTFTTHLNPLIVLQKRCIRLVCNAPYLSHSNPLFISTKVLKLADMYNYEVASFVFDIKSDPLFNLNHSYQTRNSNLSIPNVPRLTLTQHSIYFKGVQFWNSLPNEIRSINRKSLFQRQLKEYLVFKYTLL